jgi:hypothetical protein
MFMGRKAGLVGLAAVGCAAALFLYGQLAWADGEPPAPEVTQLLTPQELAPDIQATGSVGVSASLRTVDSLGKRVRVVCYSISISCHGRPVTGFEGFQQVDEDSNAPVEVPGIFTLPRPEDQGIDQCTPLRASASIHLVGGRTWKAVTESGHLDVHVDWQGR